MKATQIHDLRITKSATSFVELIVRLLAEPIKGSAHGFKYRLAYVVKGVCVVRLDNEAGKGDHLHFGKKESAYKFVSIEQLFEDFDKYIARWDHENSHT